MKKIFVTTFVLLALLASMSTTAYAESPTIESMKITANQIPDTWKLSKSFYVDTNQLKQFEEKFSSNIKSMKNEIFYNGSGGKVQVNYIEGNNSQDANKIYDLMVQMVGNVNDVAMKGNVIVEVIAPNKAIKSAILKEIKPDKVNN